MKGIFPLLATEASAARLCDMRVSDFRALVKAGHLPEGREIAPGFVRWPVSEIQRIVDGSALAGMDDIKW